MLLSLLQDLVDVVSVVVMITYLCMYAKSKSSQLKYANFSVEGFSAVGGCSVDEKMYGSSNQFHCFNVFF